MACIYIKSKLNGGVYCKKKKKEISFNECNSCQFKEYKKVEYKNTLKKINFSLSQKQKNRFSIIYHDLTKCAECGSKKIIELNEVFEGAKRQVSIDNGFVVPFCKECHKRFHNDREFALKYKKLFQRYYEKKHTRTEFVSKIHKNYLL